jgi:hypothetical protein
MRIVPITAVFAMLVLVSGCTMLPFGTQPTSDTVTFLGGEEGLDVSFVGNNPPARVFQNRNFNVLLRLENHGEQNIDAEAVRVLLSNSATFGYKDVPVKNNSESLTKRLSTETGFIPGGIEYVSFYDLYYSGSTMLTEDSPVSIAVDVCYPYKTIAVSDVCISREAAESDICDPLGEPRVDSTSGPLEVTKVNQLYNGRVSFAEYNNDVSIGVRIEFDIIGDGDLYGIQTDCNNLDNDFWKVITVDKITIGNETYIGEQIEDHCSSDVFELDTEGEGFITCDFTIEDVALDFEERFTITTSYLHSQLLNKEISVMPVLESMKKCTTSADCNSKTAKDEPATWKMYCEQPGLCRNKIPNGFECGLPVGDEPVTVTCESAICYGSEVGISGVCTAQQEVLAFCKSSADCNAGIYCSVLENVAFRKDFELEIPKESGICLPQVPNNRPCKETFGDETLDTSCASGTCSEQGLCVYD